MRSLPIPLAFATASRIKDLHIDKLLPVRRQRVTSIAWAADNQMLFYTTEDKVTKRSNQLWKLILGRKRYAGMRKKTSASAWMSNSPAAARTCYPSRSDTAKSEALPAANRPNGRWRRGRRANSEYDVDHHGDRFYLR